MLGALICTRCECVVDVDEQALKVHLRREEHGLKPLQYNAVWRAAYSVAKEKFHTDHYLRQSYWGKGDRREVLPALRGLPTLKGEECPQCKKVFVHREELKEHVIIEHPWTDERSIKWEKLRKVKLQRITSERYVGGLVRVD